MSDPLPVLPPGELRPFLYGIQVDPDDDLAIRALGDWLEEVGDPRADLVRAGLAGDLTAVCRWTGQYGEAWWGDLPGGARLEVRRGLLELVWHTPQLAASRPALTERLRELFAQGWVFRVVLDGPLQAPVAGWAAELLDHVTALRWQRADDNGLAYLPSLPRLRELDLCKSSGVGESGLGRLDRFPGLWRLYLNGCEAIVQARLSGFAELRQLRLSWEPRMQSVVLHDLPALRTLSLCRNDNFREVRTTGLPALRELLLCGCVQLRDEDLAGLAGLEALELLDLDGCVRLTGSGLHHLAGLPRLRELVLGGCDALARLRLANLPALEALDLSRSGIEELELAHLPALGRLELYSTGDLRSVRLVDLPLLDRVPLDCRGLMRFHAEDLPALRSLNLSRQGQLRDLHLRGVEGLKRLNLSGCASLASNRVAELRARLPDCQVLG